MTILNSLGEVGAPYFTPLDISIGPSYLPFSKNKASSFEYTNYKI